MQRAFLERRYGVRIRTVVGLEERALIYESDRLVLVDETVTLVELEQISRFLAEASAFERRVGGQPLPTGGAPRQ